MEKLPVLYSLRQCWLIYRVILLLLSLVQVNSNLFGQAEPNEDGLSAPPQISLIQPSNQRWLNLQVGSVTNLIWEVSGAEPIRYILLKNGNPVREQDTGNFHINVSTTPLVTEYALKAVNPHGEAVSKTVVIKAAGNPPIIEVPSIVNHPAIQKHPHIVYAILGEPLELKVKATGVGLKYQWNKEVIPIPNETNPSLKFDNTKLEDAATYVVAVSNYKGIEFSHVSVVFSIKLRVKKIGNSIRIEADAGELQKSWMLQRSRDLINWEAVERYFVPGHLVINKIHEDKNRYYYRMIEVE